MRYLFFFVHPSKFHVFKHTINYLLANGHHVEIVITSKDILESLLISEGWKYTNIFPEGRKIKNVSPVLSSSINAFRTVYRLLKFTHGKKYDLFITDDLLVVIGKLKRIPSIVLMDDDLAVVKQFSLVLMFTDHILAPAITDLGRFSKKKIPFNGYKELAYLHPKYFKPDHSVVSGFNPSDEKYFLLRLVLLRSYHDAGKKGINNEQIRKIIGLLGHYGKVFITSERELPPDMEQFRIKIEPRKILHAIYFAQAFIGDSQTMTSEAAILGTPAFRINDFVGKISVMEEKEKKFGLSYNFKSSQFEEFLTILNGFLSVPDYKASFQEKRMIMLGEKIDLTEFMIRLFTNYPDSVKVNNH
jgi:hypothetical protein